MDTSALSTGLELLPEDVFGPIWDEIADRLEIGEFAVTHEIYEEMILVNEPLGTLIQTSKPKMLLEIGDESWDSDAYVVEVSEMQVRQARYIRENRKGRADTVCLNDISIIALAKSLGLPVVSCEKRALNSPERRKIPDVCIAENVDHLDLNEFLRDAGIRMPSRLGNR